MFILILIGAVLGMILVLKAFEAIINKITEIRERPAYLEYAALEQEHGHYGAQQRCPHKLLKKTYIRLAAFDLPALYCKTCRKIIPIKKDSK